MKDIVFLSIEDVVFICKQELKRSEGIFGIRDDNLLELCVYSPMSTFENIFLYKDIFEMAATYMSSITQNHPFIEGNKRTAVLAGLVFMDLNGYEINENYDEEIADLLLDFINKKKDKNNLIEYLRSNSRKN